MGGGCRWDPGLRSLFWGSEMSLSCGEENWIGRSILGIWCVNSHSDRMKTGVPSHLSQRGNCFLEQAGLRLTSRETGACIFMEELHLPTRKWKGHNGIAARYHRFLRPQDKTQIRRGSGQHLASGTFLRWNKPGWRKRSMDQEAVRV